MCKGYAILINDRKVIGGDNSHSRLAEKKKVKEDDFLKVNVIYDDSQKAGYRIEVDSHNENQIDLYKKQGYVTKEGKIINSYLKRINLFCKENLAEIFRTLCKNLQGATIKGNQLNDFAVIEGYQSNSLITIKGNQYNNSATIKRNQTNNLATIKGNQLNDSATIEGHQFNNSATIKRNQYNSLATIEGYQYNNSATIKGDQYNNSATIEGDIIIYNTVIGNADSETSKLIKKFSEDRGWDKATLTNFIKWIKELKTQNRGQNERRNL